MILGLLSLCVLATDLEPVRIGDTGPHNAFTDLARADDKVYCAYREGDGHAYGADGKIRVLVRSRSSSWKPFALLEKESVDLRDPKLSVAPDGRVMLLCGGSYYEGRKLERMLTHVSFLEPGARDFSAPEPVVIDKRIRTEMDWLWRVTWHGKKGYGVVYQPKGGESEAHLVSTSDGVRYSRVAQLPIDGQPNEATLRFDERGRMVALVRREGADRAAHFGVAKAPYKEWSFRELPEQMGGPNVILLPDGRWLAAYRRYRPNGARTALALIGLDGSLRQLALAPSGGDTSYPGLLLEGDELLVSYYSSHEEKTCVYLLEADLQDLLAED